MFCLRIQIWFVSEGSQIQSLYNSVCKKSLYIFEKLSKSSSSLPRKKEDGAGFFDKRLSLPDGMWYIKKKGKMEVPRAI